MAWIWIYFQKKQRNIFLNLQLTEANNEVAALREKCCQYREELAQLKQQLDDMDEEYQLLAYRSRTVSIAPHLKLNT